MQISHENIEAAHHGDGRVDAGIPLSAKLTLSGLVVVIILVSLVAPRALAGSSDNTPISAFGPLDQFGKSIYALQPLPTSFQPGTLPYSEQALVITRDGQMHASKTSVREEKSKSAPQAQVSLPEEEEPIADFGQEEAALAEDRQDEVSQQVDYEAAALDAERAWLEEQRRLIARQNAEDAENARQEEAVRLAVQQQAYDAEARLKAQRVQEEEARRKAAEEASYLWSLTHPEKGRYRKAVAVGGEVVKWLYDRKGCPEDTAGMWRGTGDVDDGEGSYIVGHNPGVFHMLIDSDIGIGDIVSVWDANGNARAYTIDDVFIINEGTKYDDDLRERTTESGGESVTLQTCIEDGSRYKVFVAH